MHYLGYDLPRINIPRTPVNKGKNKTKGRGSKKWPRPAKADKASGHTREVPSVALAL
jgi:hypothetical protein